MLLYIDCEMIYYRKVTLTGDKKKGAAVHDEERDSKRGAVPQMLLTRPPRRTTAAFPNFLDFGGWVLYLNARVLSVN